MIRFQIDIYRHNDAAQEFYDEVVALFGPCRVFVKEHDHERDTWEDFEVLAGPYRPGSFETWTARTLQGDLWLRLNMPPEAELLFDEPVPP